MKKNAVVFLFVSTFFGCATLSGSLDPRNTAARIGERAGFVKETIRASSFDLVSYRRFLKPGDPVVIYIEGDGRAWLSKNKISNDPTPFRPLALSLSTLDPSTNVAYLARPYQYSAYDASRPPDPDYWSVKRFSPEVIESMSTAVDHLARESGARQVHLVGYSGGGAVAVLVASRRQDVASIRTIAGNLDPEEVNRYHGVSSLEGSLDPLSVAGSIGSIPQTHFIGSKDSVVPRSAADNFLKASGPGAAIKIVEVPGATHHDGWEKSWKDHCLL